MYLYTLKYGINMLILRDGLTIIIWVLRLVRNNYNYSNVTSSVMMYHNKYLIMLTYWFVVAQLLYVYEAVKWSQFPGN